MTPVQPLPEAVTTANQVSKSRAEPDVERTAVAAIIVTRSVVAAALPGVVRALFAMIA